MNITASDINMHIISKALTFLGVSEIAGKENNLSIMKMLKGVGFEQFDETIPWCAAFVGYVLKECKYDYLKTLRSRDYLTYGCASGKPSVGNLVVMWRESKDGSKGHVGFYLHMTEDKIWVLGGNQSNGVTVQEYPRKRVVSFRQALLPA